MVSNTKQHNIYTDGNYQEKNPTWHVEDSPWKANHILNILKRNNLQPKSVCEVGCGAGEILIQLYNQMPEYVQFYGYEISPQGFDLCKGRENNRVKFYLKDLVLENEAYFDVLLVIDVFEHVEDYLGFLKKINIKSKYKIFHIPLDLSLQRVLRINSILTAREQLGHIHYFTKETALAALEDTGYKIIDYFYTA